MENEQHQEITLVPWNDSNYGGVKEIVLDILDIMDAFDLIPISTADNSRSHLLRMSGTCYVQQIPTNDKQPEMTTRDPIHGMEKGNKKRKNEEMSTTLAKRQIKRPRWFNDYVFY
ncbi:hypothetical protein RYX36_016944 [Vicia faba]